MLIPIDVKANEVAVARQGAPGLVATTSSSEKNSHGQILKAFAVIGGSSAVNILLGAIRTKITAMLLGPAGVGLMGLYNSIIDTATLICGMGIRNSGTRRIASTLGTGDKQKLAKTVVAVRRVMFLLGIIGALILVSLAKPLCLLTFGNTAHVLAIVVLSVTIIFGAIAGALTTVAQGLRRIGDLAKINVIGPLVGTSISIPIIFFFRERGIVPSLIATSLVGTFAICWFAKRIQVQRVILTTRETWNEAHELVSLGIVFMSSAVMTLGVAYATRVI